MATFAISKEQLKSVRADLDAALAEILKKNDLQSLCTGKCIYTASGSFTFKVEGVVRGGVNKEAERYTMSGFLGLPPLGSEFTVRGVVYKTSGLNTTGSKVIADDPAGKQYLFPVHSVKRMCGVAA